MSLRGEFIALAKEIASKLQAQGNHLHKEHAEAQKHADALLAAAKSASAANERASQYELTVGDDPWCPSCYIERGIEVTLYPVPGTAREDVFRCQYGHEFRTPA